MGLGVEVNQFAMFGVVRAICAKCKAVNHIPQMSSPSLVFCCAVCGYDRCIPVTLVSKTGIAVTGKHLRNPKAMYYVDGSGEEHLTLSYVTGAKDEYFWLGLSEGDTSIEDEKLMKEPGFWAIAHVDHKVVCDVCQKPFTVTAQTAVYEISNVVIACPDCISLGQAPIIYLCGKYILL